MQNKSLAFVASALIIIVIAGGAFYVGKTKGQATKETTKTETRDDAGNVKGATSKQTAVEEGTSGEDAGYQERLAKYLTEKGAVVYGAYWCPHCKEQKALFGDALKYLNYVECDSAGPGGNPDECTAKKIEGYPTWIYEGKQYSGSRTLQELAQMVGYSDSGSADELE